MRKILFFLFLATVLFGQSKFNLNGGDSTSVIPKADTRILDNNSEKTNLVKPIISETIMGTLFGIFGAIPAGLIGQNIFALYGGYSIGCGVGVYLAGKKCNPNISSGRSLLSSLLGGVLGFSLYELSGQKGILSGLVVATPLVSSILYVHLIESQEKGRDLNIQVNYNPQKIGGNVVHSIDLIFNF